MTEEELIKLFNLPDEHCISCHEDTDAGLPMGLLYLRGTYHSVCCAVTKNFNKVIFPISLYNRRN